MGCVIAQDLPKALQSSCQLLVAAMQASVLTWEARSFEQQQQRAILQVQQG